MTRRELLLGIAATAVQGRGRSLLSVLTDEVGPDLDHAIAFAQQYKLSWVELRMEGPKMYDQLPAAQLKETRRRLGDAGLRVSFLNSALLKFTLPGTKPVDFEEFYERMYKKQGWTPESMYRDRLDSLRRALDAAKELGVDRIRSFAFWRVADPETVFPRLVEAFSEMAEIAGKAGCRILIENETATNAASSEEISKLVEKLPASSISINWDPQNSVSKEAEVFPAGYRRLPKARIGNVQMKAAGLIGPGHKLPWGDMIRALLADGYQGRFGLETHTLKGPAINVAASHECVKEFFRLAG
jgi:sugar phosphate isomerase/epimerase